MSVFDKVTVVIPSYKPDEKLLSTLSSVLSVGFTDVVVVDDGGGEKYAPIFNEVKKLSTCTVLHHDVNRGKGAALKTAFAYFLKNRPNSFGVVCADADGQHLADDIAKVAQAMIDDNAVVLGSRDFSDENVPSRSKAGNNISKFLFKALLGKRISDTQTGLRAIPREHLAAISSAEGDRYEYETNVLFLIAREKIPMTERTISTVYLDNNSSSHFRAVQDSARIYARPLKFLGISMISAIIDSLAIVYLYAAMKSSIPILLLSFMCLAVARVISGSINYILNSRIVFSPKKASVSSYLRYFLLAGGFFLIAVAAVYIAEYILIGGLPLEILMAPADAFSPYYVSTSPWQSVIIKNVIGLLLFFPSFRIQHNYVFHSKKNNSDKREALS